MTQAAPQRISGNGRPIPTHCLRGHPYTEANTYVKSNGARTCRVCHRERHAAARRAAGGRVSDMSYIDGDSVFDILAAVVRQALHDYAHNVNAGQHMPAGAFLDACGLLLPDGSIDTRGMHQTPRKERTK